MPWLRRPADTVGLGSLSGPTREYYSGYSTLALWFGGYSVLRTRAGGGLAVRLEQRCV